MTMMLTPATIALLMSSALSAVALLWGAGFAVRLLIKWDLKSGSEAQLSLERKTYLVSIILAAEMVMEALWAVGDRRVIVSKEAKGRVEGESEKARQLMKSNLDALLPVLSALVKDRTNTVCPHDIYGAAIFTFSPFIFIHSIKCSK